MNFRIQPLDLIKALSLAFDISNGSYSRHHLRTAVIAAKIALHLGLGVWQIQELIYAALLHDIGAASFIEEKNKLGELILSKEMYKHTVEGHALFADMPKFSSLAEVILHHHDCFDGSSPSGCKGGEIPLNSRIINLADRIEILIRNDINILEQKEDIINSIKSLDGYFDPQLLHVFDELSEQEAFWLDLVNNFYHYKFIDKIGNSYKTWFNIDDILDIAEIFAILVNRMSPFTAAHSHRVAEVAQLLANIKGYSVEEVKMMRAAGLFHDLGKLSVPNSILDKPSGLTKKEFMIIKQHPYYTYRILKQIEGISVIPEWAAFHHEMLDGCGYPFRIKKDELGLGARIVTVADIFVALTENRPYRKGLSLAETENIMSKMASGGKIDAGLVAELFDNKKCLPMSESTVIDNEHNKR